jgi:hypothetical protein
VTTKNRANRACSANNRKEEGKGESGTSKRAKKKPTLVTFEKIWRE